MLQTIMEGKSSDVIQGIMEVLFPDAKTVLDLTYGHGSFWKFEHDLRVTGMDIRPVADVQGSFTDAPFADQSFDVVILDPPFLTDMSSKAIMGQQYTYYSAMNTLKMDVQWGLEEAWRVSKLGIVYKCQDYIHGAKPIWMSDWAREVLPAPPFDVVYLKQRQKMISPLWKNQLSAWRNHSNFWIFRKDGQTHKKRV